MPRDPEPTAGSRARAAAVAAVAGAALVAVQGLGLIGAGGYVIVRALEPGAAHRGSTEVLGALTVVTGLAVLIMARGVWARHRRVRSPLIVLEIICLPVAVTTLQGGRWLVGAPLALVAIAVIALMGVAGLLVPRDD